MEIKMIPNELMKYIDESLLLGAFTELLRRENAETIQYMQNQIMATMAFSSKPVIRKQVK